MKSRIDKIVETISSDTQKDEVLVQVHTPLGLWLGAFNCTRISLPQLIAINKSKAGSIYFRWKGIKQEEAL